MIIAFSAFVLMWKKFYTNSGEQVTFIWISHDW